MPGSRADRVTASVERALAWTLAACLTAFAVAKLAYGHREGLQVGVAVYYLASSVELLAAGLLLTRHRLLGASVTAACFTVALLHSWLNGRSTEVETFSRIVVCASICLRMDSMAAWERRKRLARALSSRKRPSRRCSVSI